MGSGTFSWARYWSGIGVRIPFGVKLMNSGENESPMKIIWDTEKACLHALNAAPFSDPMCCAVLCWAELFSRVHLFATPLDCSPPGSSVHGDPLGKNTGVGCHASSQIPLVLPYWSGDLLYWAGLPAPCACLFVPSEHLMLRPAHPFQDPLGFTVSEIPSSTHSSW